MKKHIPFCLTLIVMLFSISTMLGANGTKKLIKKGDKQFRKANLSAALGYYQQAMAIDSTNPYVNFQIGSIYYLADSERVKSLPYFEKTIRFASNTKDDTIIDAYYYMGNCYTLLKQYPKAITAYQKYLAHVDNTSSNEEILKEVTHNISICQTAPALMKRSSDSTGYLIDGKMHPVYVKNAGPNINSPYPEYAQVLLNHDSTLIFTSRRPTSQEGKKDIFSKEYYEDIFISQKDPAGNWKLPDLFSAQLHLKASRVNLASVGITSDGKTLFIYNDGLMWQSSNSNGKWSEPVRMGKNIKYISDYMPSAFQSFDGTIRLLVSDKPGGWGGKDIYISKKQNDGTWSTPENLGHVINTGFDEDAPFLMPDNKTLYFSSSGHLGMGGYDVYRSVYENGQWSKPQNLGAPINSPADDIYFTYDTLVKMGYFSSSRARQGYGSMDIYQFSFNCDDIENTLLKGSIVTHGASVPPAATITLTDKKGKSFTAQAEQTGAYSVSLPPNKTYIATIQAPGYLPMYANITLPHQCDVFNLYQTIDLSYTVDSAARHVGQKAIVKNGFSHNMMPNYRNANGDASLSQLISNNKDSNTIWFNDTTIAMNYTPAEIDSANPGKMVVSKSIPKMPVVYFAFNKSNIEPKYNSMLDSIAAVVKSNGKYKIQIEGNTDTVGSAKYNQHLSVLRASAVAHYLNRKGVKNSQIRTLGNGKRHLAVPEGASGLNRRDDIIIIE